MDTKETDGSVSTLDLFLVKLAGKPSVYNPGDIIFSEGDRGDTMLLILGGSVQIVKRSPESDELVVLATRSPGELIGEMALVEESPRSATVIAKTACRVLKITKSNFEKIITEKPSFAIDVLHSLSNKLRESDSSRVLDLEKNNAELTRANENLRRLNRFLDSIIDQSPSAILLVTESGDISKMNKSARGIFRLESDKTYHINDLFGNFKFSRCLQDMRTTWSGDVKGMRAGQEFPVFVTCTALPTFRDEVLHLVMAQDLTEISGFASVRATEDRHASARQSAYELARQFASGIGELQGYVDQLTQGIHDRNPATIEYSHQLIAKAVRDLNESATSVIESNKVETNFAFVEIRILMRAILQYWQATKDCENITYKLDIHKDVPGRVHIEEVSIQNVMISLLNAASRALMRVKAPEHTTLRVDLHRSEDNRFTEIRITLPLAQLQPDDVIDELNRRSIFDWNYAEQVIDQHDGEFAITNNDDNYPAIIVRLP